MGSRCHYARLVDRLDKPLGRLRLPDHRTERPPTRGRVRVKSLSLVTVAAGARQVVGPLGAAGQRAVIAGLECLAHYPTMPLALEASWPPVCAPLPLVRVAYLLFISPLFHAGALPSLLGRSLGCLFHVFKGWPVGRLFAGAP